MPSKKKKILVAEDEKAYSMALVLKLQNAGFDAKSVANGEDAISSLKKDNFDLLLCDLIMPKLNGFGVLEEIKNSNIKVPVVVLTNLSQTEDEKKVRALGALDFLVKSNIQISEVINKVENYISKK